MPDGEGDQLVGSETGQEGGLDHGVVTDGGGLGAVACGLENAIGVVAGEDFDGAGLGRGGCWL